MQFDLMPPAWLRSSPSARRSAVVLSFVRFFVLASTASWAVACSPPASAPPESDESTAPTAEAPDTARHAGTSSAEAIRDTNLLESERFWPDIVAIVEPWTPEDGASPLKRGVRGALLRVEDDLRVRIAFGRHGNHVVPLEKTDLLSRANEIRRGERHKLGPNFIVHFGTGLVDSERAELGPYPALRLHGARQFLCVFADPRSPDFAKSIAVLEPFETASNIRSVFFPLGLEAGELGAVRDALVAADWLVPFAYPGGADVQARSLLDDATATPAILLLSTEGRLLLRSPLDAPDLADRIRSAARGTASAPTPP